MDRFGVFRKIGVSSERAGSIDRMHEDATSEAAGRVLRAIDTVGKQLQNRFSMDEAAAPLAMRSG
jgi:hypothetical protein